MRSDLGKCLAVVVVCILSASASDAQSQSQARHERYQAETYFGVMIAGKEISRGVNATGGEHLIARVNHGGVVGIRGGIHADLLGLEANLLATSGPATVKNEFGVAFPNHAERPLMYSGDALLYPFRTAIKEGKVRPYLTSGVGGMLLMADLDNIGDKETHGSLMWNGGGGVKVFVGEASGLYVDLRFTNHRLLGWGVDLRSVGVGVGARF